MIKESREREALLCLVNRKQKKTTFDGSLTPMTPSFPIRDIHLYKRSCPSVRKTVLRYLRMTNMAVSEGEIEKSSNVKSIIIIHNEHKYKVERIFCTNSVRLVIKDN